MLYVYETTPRNRGWLCPWNGGIKQLDLQTVLRPLLLRAVYHIITTEPTKNAYQLAIEEVERFREEPDLKMKDNSLIWWKMNMSHFQLLGRLAQMYLTVPTTSVSSERVFSTAGDFVTAQRAKLKPKQVAQLIFLKRNMK